MLAPIGSTILLMVAACALQGCSSSGPLVSPSSSLASSTIGCNNMPCSGSAEVPLIIVDGADPASFGVPISCSLTAAGQGMTFIAAPSTAWFGVTPGSGVLPARGSTTISVSSINASGVSDRNIGVVTVTASGYKDNNQMAVELNCNIAAGSCKVAFSCEPSKYPLP